MYQHGGTHSIAALVVHTEGIQQDVPLVIQRQGSLAVLVGDGVGIHAHIAGGHGVRGLARVAAIDLRTRHGGRTGGAVEGHRRFGRDGNGEGLARLHLNRGGDGAVPEPVDGVLHRRVVGGAVLAGVGDLLGIDLHHRQLVAVVELHRPENIASDAVLGHAEPVVQQFTVQEIQRIIAARKRFQAGQGRVGAGVGSQRHGAGVGVRVASYRGGVPIDVGGVQHGHLHRDLLLGHGLQSVGGLPQIIHGLCEPVMLLLAHFGDHHAVRHLHDCRPGVPQGLKAGLRIPRQFVRVILLGQIPDGLQLQPDDRCGLRCHEDIQPFAGDL